MSPLKEVYFSPETIQDKAREMIRFLHPFRRNHAFAYTPARSALLALDLQAYFLEESSHAFIPSAPAILPGVNALIQAYAGQGLPIFLTRHLNTSQDAGLMGIWWRDLITEEDPRSAIDPRVHRAEAVAICKSRYDAFYETPLEVRLRGGSVTQVVICGVMTHLCCETTARTAFMRGLEVFFTVDGTATYNEAFHRASLLNLTHGFATPVLVKDILSALQARNGN